MEVIPSTSTSVQSSFERTNGYATGSVQANHRLPEMLTTFIGREEERRAVIDLLRRQDVRMVTLTGPGGVGKTRLAIEVAHQIAPAFRDGAWFIGMESITDPEVARFALAQALGISCSENDIEPAILAELSAWHTLLVVDNLEQVLDVSPFFARLLQAGPDITLMVTSRTPLRIAAEHVFETPPLSLPGARPAAEGPELESEAVRLFVARALAANPRLDFDDAALEAVAQICERLDGFPLAIELAAGWSSILSPQAMVARLDHRLALLSGGARDQPSRLRSLRDAIAWSYDLLTPQQQSLFRLLSVFSGSFGLEAVRDVGEFGDADEFEVLETLSALIDTSLVRHVSQSGNRDRYSIYETIREFGLAMLDQQGELDRTRRRHAQHYVRLAAASGLASVGTEPDMLDRLDEEQANFREALSGLLDRGEWNDALHLAGNLAWYWFQRGHILEGRRWLQRAVGQAQGDVDPCSRFLAVLGLGLLAQAGGNVQSARDLFAQAKDLGTQTDEPQNVNMATALLAGALTTLGEHDQAADLFAQNRDRWDPDRQPIWMGHAHFHLGLIALARNDLREAARRFGQSVVAYDEGHGGLYAVDPLQYLGLVSLRLTEVDEAARAFGEALNRLEQRKSAPDLASGLANVAAIAERYHRPAEALALFAAADQARNVEALPFPEPAKSIYEDVCERVMTSLDVEAAEVARQTGLHMSLDEAVATARAVLAGGDVALASLGQETRNRLGLTDRELDVLRLIAEGQTNDEIGQTLFISSGTVRTHVSNILGKLDARTRTEAAGIARRNGLI
jgi:predicted ATPase/DNA-binding CsgD family transcriptional regulator/TolA-binding protein